MRQTGSHRGGNEKPRQEAAPPSLQSRLEGALANGWSTSLSALNASQQAQVDIVRPKYGVRVTRGPAAVTRKR